MDNSLLVNFEIPAAAIFARRITGGRWQDRVRIKQSISGRPAKRSYEADERPPKRLRPNAAGPTSSDQHSRRPPRSVGDSRSLDLSIRRATPIIQARYIPSSADNVQPSRTTSSTGAKSPTGHQTLPLIVARAESTPKSARGPQPVLTSRPARGLVESRLFSANPPAKTLVDDDPSATDVADKSAVPSNAPLPPEAASFHALGLGRRLASHLSSKLDLAAPTVIQKAAVSHMLDSDSDVFLQAETGSGKTLAYLLPIVERIIRLTESDRPRYSPTDASSRPRISRSSGMFAVILAPTRELCRQISVVLARLLACCPWLVSSTVAGGENKKSEKARIRRGVNLLIATPGRMADHVRHTRVLDLSAVRWLVLDEGDKLMEMGFEDDIRFVVERMRARVLAKAARLAGDGDDTPALLLNRALPSRRATILCSATMNMTVQKLGDVSLADAVHIQADSSPSGATSPTVPGPDTAKVDVTGVAAPSLIPEFKAPSQLKQVVVITPAKLRLVTLIALLKDVFARKGSVMKALVFISCADSADFLFEILRSRDGQNDQQESAAPKVDKPPPEAVQPAAYITSPANGTVLLHRLHGSLPQLTRTATLASFSTASKTPAVLITTDIAARGLDVPSVDLVVEFDPAFSLADHVHRIGRTARAGRPGKAVLFLQPGCEEDYVKFIPRSESCLTQGAEATLQRGLATLVHGIADAGEPDPEAAALSSSSASWRSRAEMLQRNLESRALSNSASPAPCLSWSKTHNKPKGKATTLSLLNLARLAFRSHIRAYATHVHAERHIFNLSELHLGHMAKGFALREAPTGIGSGVAAQKRRPKVATGRGAAARAGAIRPTGTDSDDGGQGESQAAVARRMRDKMAAMKPVDEFNIG